MAGTTMNRRQNRARLRDIWLANAAAEQLAAQAADRPVVELADRSIVTLIGVESATGWALVRTLSGAHRRLPISSITQVLPTPEGGITA
jgi:hypothetical protein